MSWKAEVYTTSWSSNDLRFATKEEAEGSGRELLNRWFVPTDSRAAESDDPVNYKFENGKNVRIVVMDDTHDTHEARNLLKKLNENCDETYKIVESGLDWYELWIDGDMITQGHDFDIKERLKQIARENGVYLLD